MTNLNDYYMHIQLIGSDLIKFLELISGKKTPSKAQQDEKKRKIIEDFWDFDYLSDKNIKSQIEEYFKLLEQKKDNDELDELKECLIIRIKHFNHEEINLIFEKMDSLEQTQYMPLVLILVDDINKKIKIPENFENIETRLIHIETYTEDKEDFEEEGRIRNILLRFCSIHNELGDKFILGNKEENQISYDLVPFYFPFNLNICCIGRFGQGKSTGVNCILQEYKAKESSKSTGQTKSITYYQVNNLPIRILDIPGFEDEKTVENAIEKFNKCGEEINKLKDKIHIILYFFNYNDNRLFTINEFPLIDEIIKFPSIKIIYVVTHANPKMTDNIKKSYIDNINKGLSKKRNIKNYDEIKEKIKAQMKAKIDNVVFINFKKDLKWNAEPFGKKDLFKKLYAAFIETEDYKSSLKELSSEEIDKKCEHLRNEAKSAVFWNKIGGGIVGIVPGIDWILQKYVIKKNAAKKIGQIFGIEVKFIKEEEKKEKDKKKKNTKEEDKNKKDKGKDEKENLPDYCKKPTIDTKGLDLEVDVDKCIEESLKYKVINGTKVYYNLHFSSGGFISFFRSTQNLSEVLSETSVITTSTGFRVLGGVCFGISALIGVGLGGFFTHLHCEEMIDKFVEYYKKNVKKISNSYQFAAEYLLNFKENKL